MKAKKGIKQIVDHLALLARIRKENQAEEQRERSKPERTFSQAAEKKAETCATGLGGRLSRS